MHRSWLGRVRLGDEMLSSAALVLMALIPLAEIVLRRWFAVGIDNAPLVVQHLGLVLAMFGAVLAEREGHLTSLGAGFGASGNATIRAMAERLARSSSAVLCGMLAYASWTFVVSEFEAGRSLAYGIPVWALQGTMPFGFLLLGVQSGARGASFPVRSSEVTLAMRVTIGAALTGIGWFLAGALDGEPLPLWPFAVWLLTILLCGAPIFAVLGGVALALFWQEGQPLASVSLSHYQITVNPSLPALPLFALAGLIFARSGAAERLGDLLTAAFGSGVRGTVVAAAVLCSFFTAFTGGSGVTILALGGLLLPLLNRAGFPERRGISLVTSASALGVLLAPSVPLIMYAIIARVPINEMFVAGVIPAGVMVVFLLLFGGYLRGGDGSSVQRPAPEWRRIVQAAWAAKWEMAAPLVAIGALLSGLATPTESAALTAAYAAISQALIHRDMDRARFRRCFAECTQIIGGVMLILGMALALTNYLIDAGIPDLAVAWVQSVLPDKWAFLVALNLFLLVAGALMEIFAAIVVLVPLLLPVALHYGIDPVHFGIIFLANLEMGFLCPPAGMNIYFASAMFGQSMQKVARSVLPALFAMLLGALTISALPELSTWLPRQLLH